MNYQKNLEFKNQWLPWLVCFSSSLFFFYEFIQGNMFASIADNIMQDFYIEADKMTYLSSIYYLANVLFLFIAGFLLDRCSNRKTILTAMMLCVGSTFLLAASHSFYLALFCRFVMGIGSAFCFIGAIRVASRWFEPQKMAMVSGLIITMAMIGGMLAQYPLTALVAQTGWRHAVNDIGWLGVAMLIIMYFGIMEKSPNTVSMPFDFQLILRTAKAAYLNLHTLKAALYTSLMNMIIAVFGAMMGSLYLMQRLNIDKKEAALINSMLFLGAITGGPVIGWFSDKILRRIVPMKIGAFLSLLIIIVILFFPVSVNLMKMLFFCLGFFTASQIISYALVAERAAATMTATTVSVISILTQGGYIVYQNLFSYLLMHHGDRKIVNQIPIYSLKDYQYAAMILPLGLVMAFFISFWLKETYCQKVEDQI